MSQVFELSKKKNKKEIKVTEAVKGCNGESCLNPRQELTFLAEETVHVPAIRSMPNSDSWVVAAPGPIPDFSDLARHLDMARLDQSYGATHYSFPVTRSHHSLGSMGRSRYWGMSKQTLSTLDIETVKATNLAMKRQMGDKYVNFEDKTGSWNTLITNSLKDHSVINDLNLPQKCVMGTSWDNSSFWGDESSGKGCGDCHWLGHDGLSTFSTFGDFGSLDMLSGEHNIVANDEKGFEDYKARWEYHWNKEHAK